MDTSFRERDLDRYVAAAAIRSGLRIGAFIAVALLLPDKVVSRTMRSQLQFEVASIKANPQPDDGRLRGTWVECQGIDGSFGRPVFLVVAPAGVQPDAVVPRGRCSGTRVTLLTLVATAYGVDPMQVSGGPNWVRSDAFQLEAKADDPATATAEQLRSMLQTLLTDRFKLIIRHETKEAQSYVLLAGRNGSKLKAASNDEDILHLQQSRGAGGEVLLMMKGKSRIRDFVDSLRSLPFGDGIPFLDKTELLGDYSFNLTLTVVRNGSNRPELDPPLSVAIRDQLGLRLESQRGSTDVIVIEQVDKPFGE